MKKIEVRLIKSNLTHQIRHQVLWPHKELKDCFLKKDNIKKTFHIGVFLNKELVSTGTFIKENNNLFENSIEQYRLRSMGTLKTHQGKNMGKQLIKFGLKILQREKIKLLWCDARKEAIPFYKKLGFNIIGDYYEIPNIGPHKLMYIYL